MAKKQRKDKNTKKIKSFNLLVKHRNSFISKYHISKIYRTTTPKKDIFYGHMKYIYNYYIDGKKSYANIYANNLEEFKNIIKARIKSDSY